MSEQGQIKDSVFPMQNVKTILYVIQLVCSLIVLGTAAAVIDSWPGGEISNQAIDIVSQISSGLQIKEINFNTYPQSYINIALFTSILSLLVCTMLIVGMKTMSNKGPGPTAKEASFLAIMECISVVLLWIFWFTSIITTTMVANGTFSSSTKKACCAFCWFSWFAISGSLVLTILSMISGKKQKTPSSLAQDATPANDNVQV